MKKFDLIVGNPPYKSDLHLQFLMKALDLTSCYVLFVHPSTWLINDKPKQKKLYKTVRDKISQLKKRFILFNGNGHFNRGLYMPCVISLLDVTKSDKSCHVFDKTIVEPVEFEYTDIENVNKFGNYEEYYSLKAKAQRTVILDNVERHKSWSKEVKKEDGKYYVNIAKIRGHVSYKEEVKKEDGKYYVNIAKIRGNVSYKETMYMDDFFTIVPKKLEVSSTPEKEMTFVFNNRNEANNFLGYLKTKVARFFLSLLKNNSDLESGEFSLMPWLDFTHVWTDVELCEFLKISEKEWKFIEHLIPIYYKD